MSVHLTEDEMASVLFSDADQSGADDRLRDHLNECTSCRIAHDELAAMVERCRNAFAPERLPHWNPEALLKRIANKFSST